jgi:hypothetical protein
MDEETLSMIQRMCEVVTNNLLGNQELESLAFQVGHYPDVLNASHHYAEQKKEDSL